MKEFIEVDTLTRTKYGADLPGEVIMSDRTENGITIVYVNSGRNDKQASILVNTIVSMTINYIRSGESIINAAKSSVDIFGKDIIAMTIVNVEQSKVSIIELNSAETIYFRGEKNISLPFETGDFTDRNGTKHTLRTADFEASFQDRIVLISEGITLSGVGNAGNQPWERDGVVKSLCSTLSEHPNVSAHRLAMAIVNKADANDQFEARNDMSCCSVYFRQPRKLLICTGPPQDEKDDYIIGEKILNWEGSIIISGGSTAQIAARELGRKISVNLKPDVSGLPPTSTMDGINLITEGVITLAKIRTILDKAGNTEIVGKGTAFSMVRLLLSHDIIHFTVGTKINAKHQDPSLPVELELRSNVVREITRILRSKFLKEVTIEYI